MTTFQTYEQVGIKEDVSDIISNISPTKTPFQSAIGSEKVASTLFEWQEDSLRAVAVNANVEGADPTDVDVDPTVMRNNRTQIFVESVKVSDTADKVSTYGRAKELAYQLQKSASQVKRDLEHAFVGVDQAAVVGDDSTARKLASAHKQIAAGNITSISAAALDEANWLTALQNAYTAGAEPTLAQVTPSNSLIVADFAKASGRYRTIQTGGDDKSLVNVVDLYVSPFGQVKVQVNRFMLAKYTLIIDPAMWSKATLRPWTRVTLAKTGDATRMMIVGEFSLKHKNQSAAALIKDNQP